MRSKNTENSFTIDTYVCLDRHIDIVITRILTDRDADISLLLTPLLYYNTKSERKI